MPEDASLVDPMGLRCWHLGHMRRALLLLPPPTLTHSSACGSFKHKVGAREGKGRGREGKTIKKREWGKEGKRREGESS